MPIPRRGQQWNRGAVKRNLRAVARRSPHDHFPPMPHALVGLRRRCRVPNWVEHPNPAAANMLRDATFSACGRSLASQVFGVQSHCGSFASLRFLEASLLARSRGLANVRKWDYHYDRNGQRVGSTEATRVLMVTTETYRDIYKCDHCGQTVERKRSESYAWPTNRRRCLFPRASPPHEPPAGCDRLNSI